ncbi:hypothetical protein [Sphingomonas qomolangmaensis]|uniref:Uncharacterized protein n=1 Tax=Sphingomonas qomolangmaensis TaxID=2918765 RepID=A0ABY5LD82_9SPHN|nr:hypothetical protein [Sphingomonas qomolangmaensis]UUL84066.1 hypothetical protein NMP03_07745 [Sphingomonas qomolangmaensis]
MMSYDYDTSVFENIEGESWPDSVFDWSDGEDEGESLESRRRRRPPARPVPTARGGNTFRPRPGGGGAAGPVTQAQLEAALARVRVEVRANATGIKTLDGRVRTAIADQDRFQAATRKQVDKLRGDLKTTQTLSALIPLIAKPGSSIGQVAPLLHLVGSDLMGGGGAGGGGGSSILGSNNNLVAIGALLYASNAFGSTT